MVPRRSRRLGQRREPQSPRRPPHHRRQAQARRPPQIQAPFSHDGRVRQELLVAQREQPRHSEGSSSAPTHRSTAVVAVQEEERGLQEEGVAVPRGVAREPGPPARRRLGRLVRDRRRPPRVRRRAHPRVRRRAPTRPPHARPLPPRHPRPPPHHPRPLTHQIQQHLPLRHHRRPLLLLKTHAQPLHRPLVGHLTSVVSSSSSLLLLARSSSALAAPCGHPPLYA
mmetsp:Transcript_9144/g.28051  ORF Transcript_9144/g.28051 Transcript_9144/m.28051 type:complete len:225 (+) Transcript_9144:1019-1693(+)